MGVEIKTDSIPGIVPMVSSGNTRLEVTPQLASATCDCYEACDSSGCDCFDSGGCFDICDRAPDFKPNSGIGIKEVPNILKG